jgi:hypothetical protein
VAATDQLDLRDHWVNKANGAGGDQLPANVMARWSYFARQARRSRNAYFLLDILTLVLAASIPASAALGVSIKVAAALGAAVVMVNGLRQIGRYALVVNVERRCAAKCEQCNPMTKASWEVSDRQARLDTRRPSCGGTETGEDIS